MCGRYGRRSDKQKIAEAFHIRKGFDVIFAAEDNITPGSMQPVVFADADGERSLEMMYWGFTFPTRFTFNTRSDSILKAGLWKDAFAKRRCLIPADSFYEWKKVHKKNNPKYEISIPGRHPFGFAAIWSTWKNKAGESLPTVSIITSEPNETMAEIHSRQPVIVEPKDYTEWFSTVERPPVHLLRIVPADEMKIELVSEHSPQPPLNSA